MSKLGNLRTDATAYLALVIGAGLSVAGNVADTYRTLGQDTESLDIVMAVSWPILVVLMVHMFVSTRWIGLSWPMQVMRWLGTLTIGGIAMRVSWVHLSELMASRGQKADVSALGPLAIDCLAIMATALLLAGRRTVSKVEGVSPVGVDSLAAIGVDTNDGQDWTDHGPNGPWAKLTKTRPQDVADIVQDIPDEDIEALRRGMEGLAGRPARWTLSDSVPVLDTNWTPQDTHWLARLGAELDNTTTPAAPVTTTQLPVRRRQAVRGVVNEPEALEYAEIGRAHGLKAGQIAALLAGWYGVSTRTIYRIDGWVGPVA